ncbi:unnamed protein product, partial [Ectocarpus fasciculatus]
MNHIEQYIDGATSDNTRQSYRSAINHYEIHCDVGLRPVPAKINGSSMPYVGWKHVASAMHYLDKPDPFAKQSIEHGLQHVANKALPDIPTSTSITLTADIAVKSLHEKVKSKPQVLHQIETFCFAPCSMQKLQTAGQCTIDIPH